MMISATTIAALEERGLDYILGVRERGTAVIRKIVLKNERPFLPLRIERGRGDTQLFVKQVTVHGAPYIICRNEAEAENDRADRQAIVANLEKRLSGGDKALVDIPSCRAGHRSPTTLRQHPLNISARIVERIAPVRIHLAST